MEKVKKGIISLLLPYYLDPTFGEIFQDFGFKVFWADNRADTEKIILENEPDLAIEWRYGDDDFPIRDLLRKHGRRTPVILALNRGCPLPDDPRAIGCVGYWKLSDLRGLICLFYNCFVFRVIDRKNRVFGQALVSVFRSFRYPEQTTCSGTPTLGLPRVNNLTDCETTNQFGPQSHP